MSANRDPIKRRAKPSLLLLDSDFRIAFSEPSAIELIERTCKTPCTGDRLPPEVELSVRSLFAGTSSERVERQIFMPVPTLVIRVSTLNGSGGAFTALLLERETRRTSLVAASERFSFSKRETDVLRLMLRGIGTGEVARELNISETTVTGYFKGLLRKTGSHSRPEMVAKVLGWDEDESASAV